MQTFHFWKRFLRYKETLTAESAWLLQKPNYFVKLLAHLPATNFAIFRNQRSRRKASTKLLELFAYTVHLSM